MSIVQCCSHCEGVYLILFWCWSDLRDSDKTLGTVIWPLCVHVHCPMLCLLWRSLLSVCFDAVQTVGTVMWPTCIHVQCCGHCVTQLLCSDAGQTVGQWCGPCVFLSIAQHCFHCVALFWCWSNCRDSDVAYMYPCTLSSVVVTVSLFCPGQTVATVMWPTCIHVHCPMLQSLCCSVLMLVRL